MPTEKSLAIANSKDLGSSKPSKYRYSVKKSIRTGDSLYGQRLYKVSSFGSVVYYAGIPQTLDCHQPGCHVRKVRSARCLPSSYQIFLFNMAHLAVYSSDTVVLNGNYRDIESREASLVQP